MALDQAQINEANRQRYSHKETDQGELNKKVEHSTSTSGTDQAKANAVFLYQQNLR